MAVMFAATRLSPDVDDRPLLGDSRRAASPPARLLLSPVRSFNGAVWMGAVWSSLARTSAGPDGQIGKDFMRHFLM